MSEHLVGETRPNVGHAEVNTERSTGHDRHTCLECGDRFLPILDRADEPPADHAGNGRSTIVLRSQRRDRQVHRGGHTAQTAAKWDPSRPQVLDDQGGVDCRRRTKGLRRDPLEVGRERAGGEWDGQRVDPGFQARWDGHTQTPQRILDPADRPQERARRGGAQGHRRLGAENVERSSPEDGSVRSELR